MRSVIDASRQTAHSFCFQATAAAFPVFWTFVSRDSDCLRLPDAISFSATSFREVLS